MNGGGQRVTRRGHGRRQREGVGGGVVHVAGGARRDGARAGAHDAAVPAPERGRVELLVDRPREPRHRQRPRRREQPRLQRGGVGDVPGPAHRRAVVLRGVAGQGGDEGLVLDGRRVKQLRAQGRAGARPFLTDGGLPPTANHQPPTANRQPPPTAAKYQPLFNASVVLCLAHGLTMKQRASP